MWNVLPTWAWVLGIVLGSVVVLLAVAFWGLRRGLRQYPLRCTPDETHVIVTKDGWSLPLFRWHPAGDASQKTTPVVLCHGLGVNHLNMDLDDDLSLARYLREHGWDCWVASLRSGHHEVLSAPKGHHRQDFSLDHLVDADVPAILAKVKEETGAKEVHWVGHSMGGMVVFLGDPAVTSIRSLVAVASPSRLTRKQYPHYILRFALKGLRRVPTRWFTRLFAPLAPWLGWAFRRMVRMEAVDRTLMRRLCYYMFADISPRMVHQLATIVKHESLCNEDEQPVYEERLRSHTFPAFFMVGAADGVVSPDNAKYAYTRWNGPKQWMLLDEESGFESYGHGDILVGRSSPTQVFPLILEWLENESTDCAD